MAIRLTYEDGTIRVESAGPSAEHGPDASAEHGPDASVIPHVTADPRSGVARAPAFRYAAIRRALDAGGTAFEDDVLDAPAVDASSPYELRPYQREALDAWAAPGDAAPENWGTIQLPTGSGKTVVGVASLARIGRATLIVVPTIDLLNQWRAELADLDLALDGGVGQLGGGEQRLAPVTVATYDSAYLRADEIGDRFALAIFDEVHHLGGEGYREIGRMFAAPTRLGLTATFERPDGAHETVAELVGDVAYERSPEELAGEHLAPYDVKRLQVPLTEDERWAYEEAQGTFVDYLRSSGITLSSGADYRELVKRSGRDPRAREALLAKQRAREIVTESEGKVERVADLLDRHRDGRVIVFTASTDLVYRLAERFLAPAITHETGADEREGILDRFRAGSYSRVVTANVLDEGIDVPDANVAIVVAGSGSEREFTQRLGRVLRPTEDGGRAVLYELVSEETAEERVADRRR